MRIAVVVSFFLAGCGGPGAPPATSSTTPALSAGECLEDSHCGALERCVPPGTPECGGAERANVIDCPPDRPHLVADGCGEVCVAEPPRSCQAGHRCTGGAACSPGAQGADSHGCVHLPCELAACPGHCVIGRCFERPGHCEEPAPAPEGPPAGPRCGPDEHEIETCVHGGMPRPGGSAVRCGTSCEPEAPVGSAGMRCARLEDRRWRCQGFAP